MSRFLYIFELCVFVIKNLKFLLLKTHQSFSIFWILGSLEQALSLNLKNESPIFTYDSFEVFCFLFIINDIVLTLFFFQMKNHFLYKSIHFLY